MLISDDVDPIYAFVIIVASNDLKNFYNHLNVDTHNKYITEVIEKTKKRWLKSDKEKMKQLKSFVPKQRQPSPEAVAATISKFLNELTKSGN